MASLSSSSSRGWIFVLPTRLMFCYRFAFFEPHASGHYHQPRLPILQASSVGQLKPKLAVDFNSLRDSSGHYWERGINTEFDALRFARSVLPAR
jgi:hypothetical protein